MHRFHVPLDNVFFNKIEVTNNSKAILAYTLNNDGKSIEDKESSDIQRVKKGTTTESELLGKNYVNN